MIPAIIFFSFDLKGVTVMTVGNPVQVDTNFGRSEPGPASISIERRPLALRPSED